MSPPSLDAAVRRAYERCAADLRRVFGDRFVSLVAGGPGAAAAFATSVHAEDLDALAPLSDTWRREGIPTPIVMTPDEFRRSLDTFPAEYQALLDGHVVIAGSNPLAEARIGPDDLRRACEAQARGHLIHLRQGWIDGGSHPHAAEELLARSAAPLRQVLRNLARLEGEAPDTDPALAAFAERRVGMPASLVSAVLALEAAPHLSRALIPRLPEYLAAAERLWTFIDGWRSA